MPKLRSDPVTTSSGRSNASCDLLCAMVCPGPRKDGGCYHIASNRAIHLKAATAPAAAHGCNFRTLVIRMGL